MGGRGRGYSYRDISWYGAWVPTPRWHPFYWFGRTIRRRWHDGFHTEPAGWTYGRPEKVARDMLQSLYGPDAAKGNPPLYTGTYDPKTRDITWKVT